VGKVGNPQRSGGYPLILISVNKRYSLMLKSVKSVKSVRHFLNLLNQLDMPCSRSSAPRFSISCATLLDPLRHFLDPLRHNFSILCAIFSIPCATV
jgi:hypothetical protein